MGNTSTSITQSMLMEEVLPALKLGLLPLSTMSMRAVADKPLVVGDSVTVPIVTAKSAGTYATTFESGDSTVTGTAVTIAAPTFSSWYVNPQLDGMPTAERFLAQGREAAYAVAKSVVQAVLALYVKANTGDTSSDKLIVSTANFDSDTYADAIALLNAKGVTGSVSAIMNMAYAATMMKDTSLKNASAYGGNQLITTGELPPVLGIRSIFTDAFPSAITAENTGVIFTNPESVAIAIGSTDADPMGMDAAAGVMTQRIVDPDTGLSFNWRTWMNTGTGAYWGAVYVATGVSFLRKACVRVVSA